MKNIILKIAGKEIKDPISTMVYDNFDFSAIEYQLSEIFNNAAKDFDNYLKKYFTENLNNLGFEFNNEQELYDFISKRVTRIGFANKPNEYELYVDFQTEKQKLIGLYNDTVSFSHEGSKFTATFGRSFV